MDPSTGEVVRFGDQCTVIKDKFFSDVRPLPDTSIDVSRHISFPENGGPLVVFYPSPIRVYTSTSSLFTTGSLQFTHTFQDLETTASVTCAVRFEYNSLLGQIAFNYRDVTSYNRESLLCLCASSGSKCRQFHQNLQYAYLINDSFVRVYSHCSSIPREKLVPYYNPLFCHCEVPLLIIIFHC